MLMQICFLMLGIFLSPFPQLKKKGQGHKSCQQQGVSWTSNCCCVFRCVGEEREGEAFQTYIKGTRRSQGCFWDPPSWTGPAALPHLVVFNLFQEKWVRKNKKAALTYLSSLPFQIEIGHNSSDQFSYSATWHSRLAGDCISLGAPTSFCSSLATGLKWNASSHISFCFPE